MTIVFNDPAEFTRDALEGFLDLHRGIVTGVPGGVVRATETRPGKVAVVIGGGSGHYPAFSGLVGEGFADGAVVGNVFTSPSAAEATSVAEAVDAGAGVLFSYGNYAGDVMNFGLASSTLASRGIEARTVLVTDDIASAPADQLEKRRGIAGDFVVFKIAGAAAEEGYDLDGVERIARRANDRTRTLGVAFSGCTLPGQSHPLFEVPGGVMAVGLGIHGEPGISELPLSTADELAAQLVDGVLAERPDAEGRVVAILNGLGSTKHEELFVLWGSVAKLLRSAGLTIVEPEVGELVTSLDMAGVSLTLLFLDDELAELWSRPARTPAYSKGVSAGAQAGGRRTAKAAALNGPVAREEAGPESRAAAATSLAALEAIASVVERNEELLGRLDSVAGDGDHGRGMVRGSAAAVAAAREAATQGAGVGDVLGAGGDAWAEHAGGTSGVLWGNALRAFGEVLSARLGEQDAVGAALHAGAEAITALGGARPGDKTMLDALIPFIDAFERERASGLDTARAWTAAADVATRAAEATADLSPKVGRARPLAVRSVGTPDPGAVSMALAFSAVGEVLSSDLVQSKAGNA